MYPIPSKVILFLLIILAFVLPACREKRDDNRQLQVRNDMNHEVQPQREIIKFGIISGYNPRVMIEGYQPVMDYLSKKTPYKFELKLGKTYEDAVLDLCSDEAQIAFLSALTYLEAHKQCNAVPILRSLNDEGKPFYRSVIIVRDTSAIKTLQDLRGHSFAFASFHSTSGNLIPRYYLFQAGISLSDFSHYENLWHHDSVARAVLQGKFDAGAVKDAVGYRYQEKGLHILYVSDPIPSMPIVVRPDCDPQLLASLRKVLLEIDPHDLVQQSSEESWNNEFRYGFIETSDADYNDIRILVNDAPKQCGGSCHPDIRL